MTDRRHQRVPRRFRVEYRSASSLLVAYTVNLSRGGTFLACEILPEVGSALELEIAMPNRTVRLHGRVAWIRESADEQGPRGVGVHFDIDNALGEVIDQLVSGFQGLNILVQCIDAIDRRALTRSIKSTIKNAEIVFADNAEIAARLLDSDIDLVIVDVDDDADGALATIRRAKDGSDVPSIALAESPELKERALEAGAEEVLGNPPNTKHLKEAMVRRLSNPRRIEGHGDDH